MAKYDNTPAGSFPSDTRHLDLEGFRQVLLGLPPGRIRPIAAHYGLATAHVTERQLIERLVAQRAGWPRPAVGLPAYSNECH